MSLLRLFLPDSFRLSKMSGQLSSSFWDRHPAGGEGNKKVIPKTNQVQPGPGAIFLNSILEDINSFLEED